MVAERQVAADLGPPPGLLGGVDVTDDHPVAFDGSYVWGANSLALKTSGITRDKIRHGGRVQPTPGDRPDAVDPGCPFRPRS